ncbi:m-AAA protease-interacting protein 1, mitochondrial [Centropristis striata]|uniref:m-AAA protease-interacting protein 1, mitochondrial n=1 Tax=Centropristis striata TaxID=184440 RepID=UPI0027E042C8|nr:m-AAA protease-interacting protein 1, mitochondrial [Centropristis striata]
MSLPVFRGCHRFPSLFNSTRLFLKDGIVLNRSGKTRLPSASPAPVVAAAGRPYSSERDGQNPQQQPQVLALNIPNPLLWFRNQVHYFLIRTFFDVEFTVEEFKEGAKQAFCHVSRLLSQCQFEGLEGLVAKDLVGKLEEKISLLSSDHKKALSADPTQIVLMTPISVLVYHSDDVQQERKFASILMRFWYVTSAQLPNDFKEGNHGIRLSGGDERKRETKRILTANYEFQREFTKGVTPDWIITRIEHFNILE